MIFKPVTMEIRLKNDYKISVFFSHNADSKKKEPL